MAFDLIARSTANAATTAAAGAAAAASSAGTSASAAASTASQALALAAPVDLFTNLASKSIEPAIPAVTTSGYAAAGQGAGTYISDALASAALAAAHPRFCKQTANGRYFRLAPSLGEPAISVTQAGTAATPGTNDQPAIQAAISYAIAVGIRIVRFPDPAYEVWCPVRTAAPATQGTTTDGYPIVITGDVALIGAEGGTALNLKGPTGTASRIQTVSGAQWMGGGIFYKGAAITRSVLRNLTINGGLTYVYGDVRSIDSSDKGFFLNDGYAPNVTRVEHRNCAFRNFAAEIWYMSGSFVGAQVLVENVVVDGSPQCAWNPGSLASVTAINLQAGNSYQACEVVGGKGHTYFGGRFYDCYAAVFFGGPDPSFVAAYPYNYASRRTDDDPPWVTFYGTRVENVTDALSVGSWMHGRIVAVDTTINLNAAVGALRDVHLDVEAWADRKSAYPAVTLNGPPTLTTQINNAPVGQYYVPPANIRLNITCKRTALAQANNRYISEGLRLSAGLYDKNTVLAVVSGDAHKVWGILGTPPTGFTVPRIDAANFRSTGQPFGGNYDITGVSRVYDIAWSAMLIYPSAGPLTVTLANTYGYADGQKVIFYHGDPAPGRTVIFPAAGANLKLQRDRKLYGQGDLLELRYDATLAKWVEERYVPAAQTVFTGTASYDAPNLAAGATTSTAITVTGAALGDQVTACSFDISLLGLVTNAYVSAANTVTVVLYNPTTAAINLAVATINVTSQRV